ncbi:MAG: YihY/virulence factor BrkB family protein, partial [Kiritimatiellaeota bacterium]|nr:YihY/virulence factor BrkB family protein [Kiritimatiellota bacterium]
MKPEAGRRRPLRLRAAMTWLVLRETVKAFVANNNLETAATLAYYGFLALMPLLLLVIYFLGVVLKSSESVQDGMRELTNNLFPAFSQSMLDDLLKLARGKTWGVLSLVLLVWSMTPLAGGMRSAYRRIFKPERALNFLLGKLRDLGAVVALLLLLVFLVASNTLYSAKNIALLSAHPVVMAAIRNGGLFLLTIAALMLFALVFAPVRLRWSLLL